MGSPGHRSTWARAAPASSAKARSPLACADIAIGDAVEINGRDQFRTGSVAEIGEYLHDPAADRDYFPCMVAAADIRVGVGDSGGAVLVRGLPAGVTSRSFGGRLGFTPLAEGLDALGLELCTTPDCGLVPTLTDRRLPLHAVRMHSNLRSRLTVVVAALAVAACSSSPAPAGRDVG